MNGWRPPGYFGDSKGGCCGCGDNTAILAAGASGESEKQIAGTFVGSADLRATNSGTSDSSNASGNKSSEYIRTCATNLRKYNRENSALGNAPGFFRNASVGATAEIVKEAWTGQTFAAVAPDWIDDLFDLLVKSWKWQRSGGPLGEWLRRLWDKLFLKILNWLKAKKLKIHPETDPRGPTVTDKDGKKKRVASEAQWDWVHCYNMCMLSAMFGAWTATAIGLAVELGEAIVLPKGSTEGVHWSPRESLHDILGSNAIGAAGGAIGSQNDYFGMSMDDFCEAWCDLHYSR